ncbi:hypothetical protein [Bosea sp. (in: a-proteobacteria)]|uniref:hypothetical protein n=1 Tax=Bosea sp. (in: a-proteobacteria) TaxID=1871050 RepID=UPI003B3A1531
MSVAFARPLAVACQPAAVDLAASHPAFSLSDIAGPLSATDRHDVQVILHDVAALLSKTPGAAGSMRRRLGIVIDCLLAVADEIDGDADLEAACEDEGAQCDDEGEPSL